MAAIEDKGCPPICDYFKVKNSWWDALISYKGIPAKIRCLNFIIRKTYGWQKKEAPISLKEFSDATGIIESNVAKILKGLKTEKLINAKREKGDRQTIYSFNKYYKNWKQSETIKIDSFEQSETIKNNNLKLSKQIVSTIKNDSFDKVTPIILKNNIKTIKDNKKKKKKMRPSVGFSQLNFQDKIEYLYQQSIFPKIHSFVNTQKKHKKNEAAILYTLNQCYLKYLNGGFKNGDAWAYCQVIINRTNGNYNEREHIAKAEKQKRELNELIEMGELQ